MECRVWGLGCEASSAQMLISWLSGPNTQSTPQPKRRAHNQNPTPSMTQPQVGSCVQSPRFGRGLEYADRRFLGTVASCRVFASIPGSFLWDGGASTKTLANVSLEASNPTPNTKSPKLQTQARSKTQTGNPPPQNLD